MSEFCEHETFRDICSICHRDKLITALRAENERLGRDYQSARDAHDKRLAENERLKTSGIAEVAAHNPSVMDYMRHWEGRAEKAEAENERLRAALEDVAYGNPLHNEDDLMRIARAALEEK